MSETLPPEPELQPLSTMGGWWLSLDCGCGMHVDYPLRLLAQRAGATARLCDAMARMRCKRCGARPLTAKLVDRPDQVNTTRTPRAQVHPLCLDLRQI